LKEKLRRRPVCLAKHHIRQPFFEIRIVGELLEQHSGSVVLAIVRRLETKVAEFRKFGL
jgi:hypothetical protein